MRRSDLSGRRRRCYPLCIAWEAWQRFVWEEIPLLFSASQCLTRRHVPQVKYKGEKEDAWLKADEVDSAMVAKFEAKRAGKLEKQPKQEKQEKRPLEAAAVKQEKPAKAIKSTANDDASSASAPTSAPASASVPTDLKPAVFNVMRKYLEKESIETLTKKKVRAVTRVL